MGKQMRWPGMSAKKLRKVGAYARDLADRLGLRDWTFRFAHEPLASDDSAQACIFVTYGRKDATVMLRRDFLRMPRSEQRSLLIHELLHCHLDAIEVVLRRGGAVGDVLGDTVGDMVRDTVHTAVEHATDAIASEIAKHYPLPTF